MRTLDHRYLTEVANHPDVRPHLKGDGTIDLAAVISDPANIALQFVGGGWVLVNQGACTYEVHSMFLPEHRGQTVSDSLAKALLYTFVHTDAVKLTTRLPKGNVAARALGKKAGFRKWFESRGDEFGVIAIEDWIQSSYDCEVAGHEFHDRLEAVKEASGSSLETHDDDVAHDRAAGAAYLMCKAGNTAKAVWHYNQWASLAGYQPITLISTSPMMIDVVDAVLGPDMEVLLCR